MSANVSRPGRLVVALLLLAATTACAGFRGGELPPVTGWPPAAGRHPSLSYVMTGKLIFNGTENDAAPAMLESWQKKAEGVYAESGLFSQVTRGFADTDLRAEIEVTDDGEGSMVLAFLCGFTFGLIPSVSTETFIVRTRFSDADGKPLAEIEKRESTTMWMHILLLPVTPFKFPFSMLDDAYQDVHKATLLEASANGAI